MPVTPYLHLMNVSHYYSKVHLWYRLLVFHKFIETNRARHLVYGMIVISLHVTNQLTVLSFGVLVFMKLVQLQIQTFKGPHADTTLQSAYFLQLNVYDTRGRMSLVELIT